MNWDWWSFFIGVIVTLVLIFLGTLIIDSDGF